MKKTTNIERDIPHEIAELICLNCHDRWIGVYPQEVQLKTIQCKCGCTGLVIKTGQTLSDDELRE